MIRMEVIGNRSIQDDFFERLQQENVGLHYTLFPAVHGAGFAGPRQGDHVWPEENFVYVAYTDEAEDARRVRAIVEDLKEIFADEGIRFFATPGADL